MLNEDAIRLPFGILSCYITIANKSGRTRLALNEIDQIGNNERNII